MISSLRGVVDAIGPGHVVVDVGGVGYGVHVIPQFALGLSTGDDVAIRVTTIVREDAITLYGFETATMADIFDALLGVTGVGPRSALAVLAHLTPSQIVEAVSREDDAAFTRVSGIGPKTAKLICVQLAGRMDGLAVAPDSTATPTSSSRDGDIVAALVGLGWSERAARQAVATIDADGKSAAEVLREALSVLGGGV